MEQHLSTRAAAARCRTMVRRYVCCIFGVGISIHLLLGWFQLVFLCLPSPPSPHLAHQVHLPTYLTYLPYLPYLPTSVLAWWARWTRRVQQKDGVIMTITPTATCILMPCSTSGEHNFQGIATCPGGAHCVSSSRAVHRGLFHFRVSVYIQALDRCQLNCCV